MLRGPFRLIVQTRWRWTPARILVALHARRSAEAIAEWKARDAAAPLIVVLTGTDLYHDLPAGDAATRASLDAADRLLVLQEDALAALEPRWRSKARVIHQSAPLLAHRPARGGLLRCVVVGHLRDVKDPRTVFEAMRRLPEKARVRVSHIGAALDPDLGREARRLAARDPRYRYLGALPHGLTRAAIQRADLLVHPSILEGGANVIVEAITAGTPVLASRMSGNLGMLGESYPGYFPVGDAEALARLLQRATDPAFRKTLDRACRARRPLFAPRAEQATLRAVVREMLVQGRR